MVRVSIHYPAGEGKTFDFDYYAKTHMPLAGQLLQPVRYEIDKGIGGGAPGAPAPFMASCHFYFEKLEQFTEGTQAHRLKLQGDIPNYTNIAPVIQISEILK